MPDLDEIASYFSYTIQNTFYSALAEFLNEVEKAFVPKESMEQMEEGFKRLESKCDEMERRMKLLQRESQRKSLTIAQLGTELNRLPSLKEIGKRLPTQHPLTERVDKKAAGKRRPGHKRNPIIIIDDWAKQEQVDKNEEDDDPVIMNPQVCEGPLEIKVEDIEVDKDDDDDDDDDENF